MRKSFLMLFAALLFAALPAFAQHGGHGGSSHASVGHSGGNVSHGTVAAHQESHGEAKYSGRGYNYARGDVHGGAVAHFRGGRFENHFFVSHWGGGNAFYWGRCSWFGPRWYPGSYFWFNGAYFVIVDTIPLDWYDDEVYVDDIDGGYYIVNPLYPGVRFAVHVRF